MSGQYGSHTVFLLATEQHSENGWPYLLPQQIQDKSGTWKARRGPSHNALGCFGRPASSFLPCPILEA